MHWLLIVSVSLAAVGTLVAVTVAIVIHRFNRWADAMIFSFGMLELWPPEPMETAAGEITAVREDEADLIQAVVLRWDMPQTINPAFRRLPPAKTRIAPEK